MDIEEIIISAPEEMGVMLKESYDYNSKFIETREQQKYLERIIQAMRLVDRRFFVNEFPYLNIALGIGHGQTISQPLTVARMLMLLNIKPGNNILEIGTGSGWNAALLAWLAYSGKVVSIEKIPELTQQAQGNLTAFKDYLKKTNPGGIKKFSTLKLIVQDFLEIRTEKELYDRIIFTAGISNEKTKKAIENSAQRLLKKDGRLIAPYISGPISIYYKKNKDEIVVNKTEELYSFVPIQ
ncbi:MAG: protein-L-isoaspartate O-methyltransferase [Nanoarchaeota archaeon]